LGDYERGEEELKMKYWRMRTEKEENIHYSGIDEENNMKLCPYLFEGKSYANSWDSSIILGINKRRNNIVYSDVPMFDTSCFIVNKKMLDILFQYAEGTFEILDINCIDGDYVLVNIIEKIDCIDMEKSIYKVWKGAKDEIRSYEKLYLIKDEIKGRNLFRTKHTSESFFLCSDEMKRAIEEQGIVGLNFEFID
jgi:hypothetical protein